MNTTFSAIDHAHMARALQLAERGRFTTRPNPLVGCVLAHDDEVVGEGWHRRRGEAHAEVYALRAAGARARHATAYVTLEPCAHHGRTPPCADALIAAGVARVVVATGDPFPQVDGQGVARLRAAGIAVDCGLMQSMARDLNRGFFSRIERGRPWLRVKLAISLDGRTALSDGASKWITGAAARLDVQRWRARCGALLTGAGTVRADDPRLTVRLEDEREVVPPLRVVLDSDARLSASHRVFDASAPSLRLHRAGTRAPDDDVASLALESASPRLDLDAVMAELARQSINEVQVEAGATLSGALLRAGLVDELLVYVAPVLLGAQARPMFEGLDPGRMAERTGLHLIEARQVGVDLRLLFHPESH